MAYKLTRVDSPRDAESLAVTRALILATECRENRARLLSLPYLRTATTDMGCYNHRMRGDTLLRYTLLRYTLSRLLRRNNP